MLYREKERLEDVYALGLLDTAEEPRFDVITETAKQLFDVPIALVSLVDMNRQWFKSCVGLDLRETPRAVSFCSHAIEQDGVMVIPDAKQDARFADNDLVTGRPYIRFYAGQPIHGPNGRPVGTLCIIDRRPRRLDEHQRTMLQGLASWVQHELDASADLQGSLQRQLAESDTLGAYLGDVLDALPDEIAILDKQGRIRAVNEPWRRFGRENGASGDYVGADYVAVARQGDDPGATEVATAIQELLDGTREHADIEYPCHAPGKERWFRLDAGRIGGSEEVLLRHADITERVLAERARLDAVTEREAKRQAEQAAATRRAILNAISHQINTPLTPMRVAVATMRRDHPELHAELARIDRNIDRLQRMGETVQRAVRVHSLHRLDLHDVDWQEFWTTTVGAAARRLDIDVDLKVHGRGRIRLDPTWCAALAHELLENARQHGQPPFEVRADLRRRGTLMVRDHGDGMDVSARGRLFQAFSSSEEATQAGIGLGLYMVQRVADLHGGSVAYRDAGPGAAFEVQFTRRRAAHRGAHPIKALRDATHG